MSTDSGQPCEFLNWDSAFFDRRIARVSGHRLTSDQAEAAMQWCHDQQIDCLYFLADSDDPTTIDLAETHGFRLVDVRLTLERKIGPESKQDSLAQPLRPYQAGDLNQLKHIASYNHVDSRFFWDAHFSDKMAAKLYSTWIEKSCHGMSDIVLVYSIDGEPAGYLTCERDGSDAGKIGLVGVDRDHRGGGIGSALVSGGLHWFASQGMSIVSVVTQGRNVPAQRLYMRHGFISRSLQFWYHRWFTRA